MALYVLDLIERQPNSELNEIRAALMLDYDPNLDKNSNQRNCYAMIPDKLELRWTKTF